MGHLEAKAGREKTVKGCLSVSESGGPAFSFRPDAQDSVYIYIYIYVCHFVCIDEGKMCVHA